jgi:acyl carrier protein
MNMNVRHPVSESSEVSSQAENPNDAAGQIAQWLNDYVARLFDLSADQIKGDTTFRQYGLDSSAAVGLSGELGDWLGCGIDPAIAYEHPSINELAKALAAHPEVQRTFNKSRISNACGEKS